MDQKRCVHAIQAVSSARQACFSSFYPSQIRPRMMKECILFIHYRKKSHLEECYNVERHEEKSITIQFEAAKFLRFE